MKKLMKSVLACALAFAMVLTVMPVNTYAANKKAVVVTNQKQLEKALKNGATNIVIKTNKNVKITIPASKKAAKASISVQAKNATITNKASVKSIEIKDAKAFVESGKNNDIKITDSKLSLTVSKASKGADIQVAKKDADIKVVAKGDVASVTVAKTANVALTVNKTAKVDSVNVAAKGASVDLNAKGTVSDVKVSEKAADTKLNINASGKVENVQIDAKADVAVAGSTTEAVKVTVNAKDTTIKAETAVDTTLNADAKLDLSKGAEGSTVTTAENVKADVANNTTDKVTVKDSTGKETSVDAGKTETKTDDEKKDDQKTDDNSGTVIPAPIPLRISSAMVCSSTEVRVYFNQTVPNEIATDQVVITDEAGNAVSVESVERGEPDTQAYFVTLSNVLKDGKYQVELTISNQKFVTSFLYDETVWAPLDAALKIVNEEFKKTHTVSVSGLESAEICRQAFEKNLMAAINNDTEAKKVQVEVETRDFEYEPDEGETIADNHKKVCIWIGLYMGESANYMTDEFVDFECTGEAVEAKAPEIVGVTKTSIIVKAEKGQEYIALDKNTDISTVNDDSWYGFNYADSNGNIEIEELASDITYVVYTRIHGLSPKAAANEISLSEKEGACVVFKECNTLLKGTVSYDEQSNGLKLNIPFIVNDVASFYGDEDCQGRILVKESDGLKLEVASFNENEIQFNLCGKPSAKEYNITFQYVVFVGDNEVENGAKEFKAHFAIKQGDLGMIQEEQ